MKQLLRFISGVVLILSISTLAQAQQAKVLKVKGQQAIVTFPDGMKPQVGQVLYVNDGGEIEASGVTSPVGSRAHVIIGTAELSILSNSQTSTSSTGLTVGGGYGWNKGWLEYGPLGSLSYSMTSPSYTRAFAIGGFIDANFAENKPGVVIVPGVGGSLMFGSISAGGVTGVPDTSASSTALFAGGNVKWFPLGNSVAVRGDAGLKYQTSSGNNTMGLDLKAALQVYF